MPEPRLPLVLAALLALSAPATAQTTPGVTVNPGALDQLGGGSSPPAAPPTPHEPPRPAVRPTRPAPPARPTAAPKPAMPIVPPGPPPPVALAPLSPPPPAHPTAPPPPAPVVADAPGAVSPIAGGTRLTFGPLRSDLNPITDAALQDLAHKQAAGIFNVMAYAGGTPEDPSTPRRLSLSRALNVRSVLITEGIPSTRIYVRALGPNLADGPPDRVDITVTAPQAPAKPPEDSAAVRASPQ